jgi:hypothetical protein
LSGFKSDKIGDFARLDALSEGWCALHMWVSFVLPIDSVHPLRATHLLSGISAKHFLQRPFMLHTDSGLRKFSSVDSFEHNGRFVGLLLVKLYTGKLLRKIKKKTG